jgi:exopolyphosphatase/guanosine-5'-triphosphate,3'-diphosphate pyrophosphatase
MSEAETALGHPIEIISGLEEARLIYKGVAHSLPLRDGRRLVLDIGGGSTELILGEGQETRALESVHLGCVAMTERFFGDGRISAAAFERARVAARLELRPVKAFFRSTGDLESIGTSGTIRSAERVATSLGIIDSHCLTPRAVEQLIERVLAFETIGELSLQALSERRAQVWPGGLSILAELLGVLRVSSLKVADGALREGLLYDLLGRLQHEDARERSVRAIAARYHVDSEQAKRVAATAAMLLQQCAEPWQLGMPLSKHMLEWAARLHEIGLDISHDGYQRHGAYIAANADLPGFPRAEQRFLALLVGCQRHQIDALGTTSLPRAWRTSALRLTVLLRLAVLLNRSRSQVRLPAISLSVTDTTLRLGFEPAWLLANPLTVADLEREVGYLRSVGYDLSFN